MGAIVEALEDTYYVQPANPVPLLGGRYLISTTGERSGGVKQRATIHDLDTHTYKVFRIRAPGGATLDDGGPMSRQWQEYGGGIWQAYLYSSNKIGATVVYPDGTYESFALTGSTPTWGNSGIVIGTRLLVMNWAGTPHNYYRLLSYPIGSLGSTPVDLGQMDPGPGGGWGTQTMWASDGTHFYVGGTNSKIRKWTNLTTGAYTDYTIPSTVSGEGWWDAASGVIGCSTSSQLAFLDVSTMTVTYVTNPYPQPFGGSLTCDYAGVWHWVGNNMVYSYDPSTGAFNSAAVTFPCSDASTWPYGTFIVAIGGT